jgi:hypothetical protein
METKNRIEIADISNIKYFKYGRKSKGLSSESVMNLSENYMIVIAFSYADKEKQSFPWLATPPA